MRLRLTVGLFVLLLAIVLTAAVQRTRARMALSATDPSSDSFLPVFEPGAHSVNVEIGGDGFRWPSVIPDWDTGFLEIHLDAGRLSLLTDPYVEVSCNVTSFRQAFGIRASGVRFLNVSPLAGKCRHNDTVRIVGTNVGWSSGRDCRNSLTRADFPIPARPVTKTKR